MLRANTVLPAPTRQILGIAGHPFFAMRFRRSFSYCHWKPENACLIAVDISGF
jgi:hypothetical protein